MKAITTHQPYAELIARGEKRVENRSWNSFPAYTGPLLIHAGKSRVRAESGDFADYGIDPDACAYGSVVAVCELEGYAWVDDPAPARNGLGRWPWLSGHEHAEGPLGIVLGGVRRLARPVPWRGMPGLWDVPGELAALVRGQLLEAKP